MKNYILFCLLIISGVLTAQDDCMSIGTNFHFFDAGVYKDLKKSSSEFFTRNEVYQDDGNDWDSYLSGSMPQDDAGYPTEVPFTHPGTGLPQIVAFTVGGYGGNYRSGNYVLLHEGTGTFSIPNWIGAHITSTSPGRVEFTVDYVDENGIHIEITSSQNGNHIRNIRIMEAAFETNYEAAPLYPDFQSKANEFSALRFMDWTHTNHHPISTWTDRTRSNFHTQNMDQEGISWESVIEISNSMNKDVWINVPHLADENYIQQLAVLFRDNLSSDLTIYLEYSNECWNWIFDQTHWLDSASPYNQYGRNYGHYSHLVFETWDEVFQGQENRIKTVLAGHDYFVLDAIEIFEDENAMDLVDLVSYPGYVGLDEENYETLTSLGNSATGADVMQMLRDNTEENFYWMQQFKTLVADAYGKDFVMYEGGQHITPEYFGFEGNYNHALYEAQVHPDMYTFYQDMLDYYKDELDITLFMNYVLASPQESPFGSWGLLENYFSAPDSPKWNSVMDWKNTNGDCLSTSVQEQEIPEIDLEIFPNPSSEYIQISNFNEGEISIYSSNGKLIIQEEGTINQIDIKSFPSGKYWIKIKSNSHSTTKSFIKI